MKITVTPSEDDDWSFVGEITWEDGKVSGSPIALEYLNSFPHGDGFGIWGIKTVERVNADPTAWVCMIDAAFPGCEIEGYEGMPEIPPGAIR